MLITILSLTKYLSCDSCSTLPVTVYSAHIPCELKICGVLRKKTVKSSSLTVVSIWFHYFVECFFLFYLFFCSCTVLLLPLEPLKLN